MRKWVQKGTQQLRLKLMNELEAMFDMAKEALKAKDLTPKQVQGWMHVGYLGQVMNSLSKSFDEAKALAYLKRLERMVREAKGDLEEGKGN